MTNRGSRTIICALARTRSWLGCFGRAHGWPRLSLVPLRGELAGCQRGKGPAVTPTLRSGSVAGRTADARDDGGWMELDCDILIIGAGCGGVAATLTAARLGRRVVLTEATTWV